MDLGYMVAAGDHHQEEEGMNLYQFAFGHQPHYVVAMSYGDASVTIKRAGYSQPKKIECLGPYVLISDVILPASARPKEEE